MKKRVLQTLLAATFAVSVNAVFAQDVAKMEPIELPDPVATVKGQPLAKDEFVGFVTFVTGGNIGMLQSKEQVNNLIEAYVLQRALANKAVEEKLDQAADFQLQMEQLKLAALAELSLVNYGEKIAISDEDIKAEYDKQLASVDKQEFKAAHILVESEEEAKKIIKELNEGKIEFVKAAEDYSIDPGSGAKGGDLGWFRPQMMVAEFSDALMNMKKGEISQTPVKSQFGYHIIHLEDSRATDVMNLDDSKESIKQLLTEEKLRAYIEEVSNDLEIEFKLK